MVQSNKMQNFFKIKQNLSEWTQKRAVCDRITLPTQTD